MTSRPVVPAEEDEEMSLEQRVAETIYGNDLAGWEVAAVAPVVALCRESIARDIEAQSTIALTDEPLHITDGRCEASFWREGLSGYRCVMEAGHFPSTPHALNGDVSWTEPLCGYEAEPGRRCIRTDDHSHSSDPTPAPGISEERLEAIAARVNGEGPTPPNFRWVNDAAADRRELLAEVRRLRQQVEAVEALLNDPQMQACPPNEAAGTGALFDEFDIRAALGSSHG